MDTKRHKLVKRSVQKDDGRLLIFYNFECNEACTAGLSASAAECNSEETINSPGKKTNSALSEKTSDSLHEDESHGKVLE